jgi:hypothetical protein
MKTFSFFIIVIGSFLFSQKCYSQIDSTCYVVYSTYLKSLKGLLTSNKPDINTFVVFRETKNHPFIAKRDTSIPIKPVANKTNTFNRFYPEMEDETVTNFIIQSQKTSIFDNKFMDTSIDIIIADNRVFDTLNNNDTEGYLYKELRKAKGMVLTFSNIGFNRSQSQALFYVDKHSGSLSSSGEFIILEKKDGIWVIVKTIEMWRS